MDPAVSTLSQRDGSRQETQQQQCSCLLTVAGSEALEIFNTFALSDADETKIEVVTD